jgi:hypothetical protein
MQWDKEMMRKEIPGGYISIRLATWWGEDVVPHSFTLFTAVSPAWIVTGTIEEDVPRSTGEIVTSFAFLPAAAHSEKTLIETHANNWD